MEGDIAENFLIALPANEGEIKRIQNPKFLKQFLVPQPQNLFSEKDILPKPQSVVPEFDIKSFNSEAKKGIAIQYSITETQFGSTLVASCEHGVCFLGFDTDTLSALEDLRRRFSEAKISEAQTVVQLQAIRMIRRESQENSVPLALFGTNFQYRVWQQLLGIPVGEICTYSYLAQELGDANLSRAVGSAIGANPIAVLIPCHRVVQSTGALGGYMWGIKLKAALLANELSL